MVVPLCKIQIKLIVVYFYIFKICWETSLIPPGITEVWYYNVGYDIGKFEESRGIINKIIETQSYPFSVKLLHPKASENLNITLWLTHNHQWCRQVKSNLGRKNILPKRSRFVDCVLPSPHPNSVYRVFASFSWVSLWSCASGLILQQASVHSCVIHTPHTTCPLRLIKVDIAGLSKVSVD